MIRKPNGIVDNKIGTRVVQKRKRDRNKKARQLEAPNHSSHDAYRDYDLGRPGTDLAALNRCWNALIGTWYGNRTASFGRRAVYSKVQSSKTRGQL